MANDKLNLGFCAALFNACPGLEPPDEQELKLLTYYVAYYVAHELACLPAT